MTRLIAACCTAIYCSQYAPVFAGARASWLGACGPTGRSCPGRPAVIRADDATKKCHRSVNRREGVATLEGRHGHHLVRSNFRFRARILTDVRLVPVTTSRGGSRDPEQQGTRHTVADDKQRRRGSKSTSARHAREQIEALSMTGRERADPGDAPARCALDSSKGQLLEGAIKSIHISPHHSPRRATSRGALHRHITQRGWADQVRHNFRFADRSSTRAIHAPRKGPEQMRIRAQLRRHVIRARLVCDLDQRRRQLRAPITSARSPGPRVELQSADSANVSYGS